MKKPSKDEIVNQLKTEYKQALLNDLQLRKNEVNLNGRDFTPDDLVYFSKAFANKHISKIKKLRMINETGFSEFITWLNDTYLK